MGNFLFAGGGLQHKETTAEKEKARMNLINFIKHRIRLNQLPRLVDDFIRDYAPNNLLNRDEFHDCFCHLLNVTETLFDII